MKDEQQRISSDTRRKKIMLRGAFFVLALMPVFFLMKGENSPCYLSLLSTNDKGELSPWIWSEYDISAYSYYFVWTKPQRDVVRNTEWDACVLVFLARNGYSNGLSQDELAKFKKRDSSLVLHGVDLKPLTYPTTLSELMLRNILIAIASMCVLILLAAFFFFRPRFGGNSSVQNHLS